MASGDSHAGAATWFPRHPSHVVDGPHVLPLSQSPGESYETCNLYLKPPRASTAGLEDVFHQNTLPSSYKPFGKHVYEMHPPERELQLRVAS
jgi:hypothetical protein